MQHSGSRAATQDRYAMKEREGALMGNIIAVALEAL
jgi:hypothetical protein